MRSIELAFKDIKQILRDKKSLLFLVLMPLVFTLFMGFAYGQMSQPEDPRLAVGWINLDEGGTLSAALRTDLERSEVLRLEETTPEQAGRLVQNGKLAAVLTIPDGFSQKTLDGEVIYLDLLADRATSSGSMAEQAIRAAVVRALSAAETARLAADLIRAGGSAVDAAALRQAAKAASRAWAAPALGFTIEKAQADNQTTAPAGDNPFNQASPGMIVQFAVFGLINSAMLLVLERQNGCLPRLLTTSMSRAEVIAGHLLAMFAVSFLQGLILVLAGQFAFEADYLRQPLATLIVLSALALWAASLGMLIGTLAQGEDQVILYAMAGMFLFSALGGAWFPLEGVGRTFAAIGRWMPSAHAMTGFQNILIRGQGINSVLLPAAVLLAWAAGCFGLAVWRFKKEA